ncbi:MAG TPA: response regulator [Vicinamibacterales bacterium]|jgi:CheY-like chemotaxis protein
MRAKRILIVEDDAALRRVFRMALAIAGYDVQEAGDGYEALQLVENDRPDLVVLDLILRAVDGLSVQQELASRAPTSDIPIVVVTGSTIDTSTLDVACVLHKPVTPEDLIYTVSQCLHAGSPVEPA